MSFLSQTAKIESPFESFYGTNIAGSQIATSELNEEEVYCYIKDEHECFACCQLALAG